MSHAFSPSTPFFPPPETWINTYARLSDQLVAAQGLALGQRWEGAALNHARWVDVNPALCAEMGWPVEGLLANPNALKVFSGEAMWAGMAPMATVYSGHQFGQWAGQLGDGRALLLGEFDSPVGGLEVQLKGAGPTPYSRRGDGRAVLRSSIREYLCSEAMHALGIPTTRALCLVASDTPVRRESMETAAVVTRVAPSFIRFGHFEHFAYQADPRARVSLNALVTFALKLLGLQSPVPDTAQARALALLREVCHRTAVLMAHWQAVGFCHGVMNTDNMSVLGLTMDYGPFGFMDGFDPDHVCNHSDTSGRYRWRNQPDVAWWNLAALAQALSVLWPAAEQATSEGYQALHDVLDGFKHTYEQQMAARWRAKLGLDAHHPQDEGLIADWLSLLAQGRVDFTMAFRRLGGWRHQAPVDDGVNTPVRDLFVDRAAFDAWALRYNLRLQLENSEDGARSQTMSRVNPQRVLRNHLAQQAIVKAEQGDFSEVQRLRLSLAEPFTASAEYAADADFPPDWASGLEISCSS